MAHLEPLRISFFGTLSATRGDVALRVAQPPALANLLARVALSGGTPLERSALAESLWPDDDPVEARNNLRRHAFRLAAALGDAGGPWLAGDRATIAPTRALLDALDVTAFELALAGGNDSAAIELYAGDLLPQLDDETVVARRERLRENVLDACDRRSRRLEDAGDHTGAIAVMRRSLAVDPWRESSLRRLMTLLYVAGDRAAALSAYENFRVRLREELDAEPSPETEAAYAALHRVAREGNVKRVLPSVSEFEFVGRERELGTLEAALARTVREGVVVAHVSGDAGVGKTRLLAEFVQTLQARGITSALAQTLPLARTPYDAIAAALRGNVATLHEGLDPAVRAQLGALVPELRSASTLGDEVVERDELYSAVAAAFALLASAGPFVTILDDMHFASAASLELLGAVAASARSRPLLFVLAFREGTHGNAKALRALRSRATMVRVPLGPLDSASIRRAVTPFVAAPAAGEIAHALSERSGGNPMFLRELVRESLEDGRLSAERVGRLPAAVFETMVARLDALDDADRRVVEIAAVAGQTADVDLLALASGAAAHRVRDATDRAVDAGILTLLDPAAGDLGFAHQLLRESVYLALPEERRRVYHRRIGRALAELGAGTAPEVADHLERAGDHEAAAIWHLTAARDALALFDYDRVAQLGRLIVQTNPALAFDALLILDDVARARGSDAERSELLAEAARLASAERRLEVVSRRIEAAALVGDFDAEEEALAELERTPAGANALASLALMRARVWFRRGHFARALDAATDAEDLCSPESDDDRFEIELLRAEIAGARGDHAAANDALERANEFAAQEARHGERLERAQLSVYAAQNRFADVYDCGRRLLERAERIGDRQLAAHAHGAMAPAAARLFRVDAARAHFEAAAAAFSALGNVQRSAATLVNHAVFAEKLGRHEEALERCEAADRAFERVRDLRGRTVAAVNRVPMLIALGRYDEALTWGRRARRLSRLIGSERLEAYALANLGAARARLGRFESAAADMLAALSLRRRAGVPLDFVTDLREYALVLEALGRRDEARTCCDELAAIAREHRAEANDPQLAFWSVARIRRRLGEDEAARAALEDAYAALLERAAAISDPAERAGYLSDGENGHIAEAAVDGVWP